MAENDKAKLALFATSALAAIFSAVAAFKNSAKAAGNAVVSLPEEVLNLWAAIADGIAAILIKLDDIITAIKSIQITGGNGGITITGGYPDNNNGITATFVQCPQAQPLSYQLPPIAIPKGRSLDILARNPAGANVGVIWISFSQVGAQGNLQARPLIGNATISYNVKNANAIWIGATVPGEGVYLTVEQD
jgi:hypothetical protein